jgi:FdrA protein
LHPMMDNDLRIRRLLREAADSSVATILLDVVLGYGAHPDPAHELAPAIAQARSVAARRGQELIVIAYVCGTADDPQHLPEQEAALQAAGAILARTNAAAARLAGRIASR